MYWTLCYPQLTLVGSVRFEDQIQWMGSWSLSRVSEEAHGSHMNGSRLLGDLIVVVRKSSVLLRFWHLNFAQEDFQWPHKSEQRDIEVIQIWCGNSNAQRKDSASKEAVVLLCYSGYQKIHFTCWLWSFPYNHTVRWVYMSVIRIKENARKTLQRGNVSSLETHSTWSCSHHFLYEDGISCLFVM